MALILLIFFIPTSTLIPGNLGEGFLYIMYIVYLVMEIESILENYKKIGINTSFFEEIKEKIKKNLKK